MEEEGRNHFYFQDDLGSPMRLADGEGRSEEIYGFDEFGNDIRTGRDIFRNPMQSFGFTGYQMDEAGGLYFAKARRYDAGAGRFTSEDFIKGHIAVPYTMNHYNYCWNRPMDLVDLNGLSPQIPDYIIEGNEAHRLLQAKFVAEKPGGQVEYQITSGITSNKSGTGRADIVYFNSVTRTVEVYEIKPGSYAPGKKFYGDGQSQLNGYISALNNNGQIVNGWKAKKGVSLNSYFDYMVIPSVEFPNKEIVYRVYENGLINYYYRNKTKKQPQPDVITEEEKESQKDYSAMVRIGCGVTGTFATIGLGVCVLDNIFGVGVVDDAAIPALGSTAFAMFTIAFTGEDPGSSCDVY